MLGTNEWIKRIVERFIERSSEGSYSITNVQDLIKDFGYLVDSNFMKAWNELISKQIIFEIARASGKEFLLNTWGKTAEIREIFNKEPIPERAENVKPEKSYFEGLSEHYAITTENAWPNQGTYYFSTKEDDPSHWVVIFRSKPNKRPTRYDLGSIKDEDSRISKMWKVIVQVWHKNQKQPIYKKLAENKDQVTFGNNRQPAVAGFTIFVKFGWLQEVSRKGKQIFYNIIDEKSHQEILNGKIPICPRCGSPAPDHFCHYCDSPI